MEGLRGKIALIGFVLLLAISLSGCTTGTDAVTDTITQRMIKVMKNPDPSLTSIEVRTDGMLSVVGYAHPHPFGLWNKVLADMKYYEQYDVSRGDIVVFATKTGSDQDTDIARVVGLPGETVEITKGQAYINDRKLDTFYGDDSTFNNNDSWDALKLKENEYFILADVRWRGFNDSQTNGAFSKQDILGKIVGYEPAENQSTPLSSDEMRSIENWSTSIFVPQP